MADYYGGQRLSSKGDLCTVRYVGPVQGKAGIWLGVEWDDPSRGKHSGSFEDVEYFKCRSRHPTAGSFVRPTAQWDHPRTFLQALKEKYAPDSAPGSAARIQPGPDIASPTTVWISGKQVEELGYDKISRRQAQLGNLRIVILDGALLSVNTKDLFREQTLVNLLPNATELDISRNLIETMGEVVTLCSGLPALNALTLDGNHLNVELSEEHSLSDITTLSLNSMLLLPRELSTILSLTPSLQTLSISGNSLLGNETAPLHLPRSLSSLTAESNNLETLQDVAALVAQDNCLQSLNLKNNRISSVLRVQVDTPSKRRAATTLPLFVSLEQLDLSGNEITSWDFVNDLRHIAPNLKHLRLSQNPLYSYAKTITGKALSETDVSLLIIARLPKLKSLNYSTVSNKERLSGEKLYLSHIGEELSQSPVDQESKIIASHPRYGELCEEYGEPTVQRQDKQAIDPNSLAARLVKCHFHVDSNEAKQSLVLELPRSMSIYAIYGAVARHLGQSPQNLRLVWNSGERDPVAASSGKKQGVQEWDSEDEDEAGVSEWVERRVELNLGTRPIGTVMDKTEESITVELRGEAGNTL